MSAKDRLKAKIDERFPFSDPEEAEETVRQTLECYAEYLQETAPSATAAINRLNDASFDIMGLADAIDD